MTYFETNYENIKLPYAEDTERSGLRNAQIGAVHAIAAHFTIEDRPAIAVLPTGSGKTAVLMISAFILRAQRVMVITPSVLVRDQIAQNFEKLSPLKEIGVISQETLCPKVFVVKSKISTIAGWHELEEYDVVVATPNCVSSAQIGICAPPKELFDLVLVDEAHHSPARTWQATLEQFPESRKVLVTATPFRQDRKEIKGKFIYSYSIRQAHKDGIYGEIEFIPVTPGNINEDIAIATKAESVIGDERENSRPSVLLVRTDQKKRAKELLRIYEEHTSLRVKPVDSSYSERYVSKTLRELESGTLDGIICVNMLGEGVDFPKLKVAALHRPHKSLEITLQFIGRFARTNDPTVGNAKFIAVPNDIKFETERLYKDRSAWIDLVSRLSEARIEQEQRVYNVLDGFRQVDNLPAESGDISLYSFKPYFHVMVFRVNGTVNFNDGPSIPQKFNLIDKEVNEDESTCIVVSSEESYPRWTRHEYFLTNNYHLAILYYHTESNILFINSSIRSNELCREMVSSVVQGEVSAVPLHEISRVLLDFNNLKFFNVGMRNRAYGNRQESYRTLAGGNADQAVSEMDGRLYNQGHVFGKGIENGNDLTIGYSSSSKIWMNQALQVPMLIDSCAKFAKRIASDRNPQTHTQLDFLSKGRTITEYPQDIAAIYWNYRVYQSLPRCVVIQDGRRNEHNLIDFTIELIPENITSNEVQFVILGPNVSFVFSLTLTNGGQVSQIRTNPSNYRLIIDRLGREIPIEAYFNSFLPPLYTSCYSMIEGNQQYDGPEIEIDQFDNRAIKVLDWDELNIDITTELGSPAEGKLTIHAYFEEQLTMENDLVFYDHTQGEVADFITFKEEDDYVRIELFHCKASKEEYAGRRAIDYYEVCSQTVKSTHWAGDTARLRDHMAHRSLHVTGTHFCGSGNLDELDAFLERTRRKTRRFWINIVQPGISSSNLGAYSQLLISAQNYIRRSRGQELTLICSQ